MVEMQVAVDYCRTSSGIFSAGFKEEKVSRLQKNK
jgi:hypothetical protein